MALTVFCKYDGICKRPVLCGGKLFCDKEPAEIKEAYRKINQEKSDEMMAAIQNAPIFRLLRTMSKTAKRT